MMGMPTTQDFDSCLDHTQTLLIGIAVPGPGWHFPTERQPKQPANWNKESTRNDRRYYDVPSQFTRSQFYANTNTVQYCTVLYCGNAAESRINLSGASPFGWNSGSLSEFMGSDEMDPILPSKIFPGHDATSLRLWHVVLDEHVREGT
jgi:hypothetical protein